MRQPIAIAAAVLLGIAASPVLAKEQAVPSQPAVFQAVIACKTIIDPAERLACYDRSVEELAASAKARTLVVSDVATVKAQDAKSFGLAEQKSAEDSKVTQSAKISAVNFNPGSGEAVVTLDNGQVWKTSSNGTLAERLRAGQNVTITQGGMFGYRLRIYGRTGFQAVVRIR